MRPRTGVRVGATLGVLLVYAILVLTAWLMLIVLLARYMPECPRIGGGVEVSCR